MNCFCPKCSATITPDLRELPDDGAFLKCPECNTGFSLQRESFAKRALRKGAQISCAECGSPVGTTIHCHICHALYPDYYVTETSSAAKKKLDRLIAAMNRPRHKVAQATQPHETRQMSAATPTVQGTKPRGKSLQFAITVIVLLALLGGGGFYYYQDKTEKEYAEKYVRTLFIIKTAADLNIRLSTKFVNDWQASRAPNAPGLTAQELKSLKSAKSDVEIQMTRIDNAPQKLSPSRDAISAYHASYLKLHALTVSSPASLDSFASSAKRLEDNFRRAGKELKSGMPEKIAVTFKENLTKYTTLQEL